MWLRGAQFEKTGNAGLKALALIFFEPVFQALNMNYEISPLLGSAFVNNARDPAIGIKQRSTGHALG